MINYILFIIIEKNGDWGLGIGDWGLGIGDWANPQSPIPNLNKNYRLVIKHFLFINNLNNIMMTNNL